MFKAHRQASECWAVGLAEVQWSTTRQFWNMFRCKIRSFATGVLRAMPTCCRFSWDRNAEAAANVRRVAASHLAGLKQRKDETKSPRNTISIENPASIKPLPVWARVHVEWLFYHWIALVVQATSRFQSFLRACANPVKAATNTSQRDVFSIVHALCCLTLEHLPRAGRGWVTQTPSCLLW